MGENIAVLIPIIGFVAFIFGYFVAKRHWKIADYF